MNIKGKEISNYTIVAAIILAVVIIAAVAYFMLRDTGTAATGERDGFFGFLFGGGDTPPEPLTGSTDSKTDDKTPQYLFRISTEPVAGATLSPTDGRVRYFKKSIGNLFENTFTGNEEMRISNVTIPAVLNAQWTPSKEYAVVSSYADGGSKRLWLHIKGTSTITSAFLPSDIQEIAVSHTEEKIIYSVPASGKTALLTARPDNTAVKNIYTTPAADFEIVWPTANTISLKTKSSAYASSFFYALNPATGALTRILAEKEGLDILWSPGGTHALVMETAQEGTRVSLYVLTMKDSKLTTLPFITLPEKCVWSAVQKPLTLYCAVPKSIPAGTNLPDEWWQGTTSFNDSLERIIIENGIQKQQLLPAHEFDGINLFLAKDDAFLFFTNKKDGILWGLRLK